MSERADEPARNAESLAQDVATLSERLARRISAIGLDAADHDVPAATVEELLASAIKLYATAIDREGADFVAQCRGVTTTEAVTVISALMQAHDLNTFDLAVWQAKLRRS